MDKWLRVLYSPEGDGNGGGSGGAEGKGSDGGEHVSGNPPTDPPPPAAFDMTSKIKMMDGTEVTVGELMDGYQKHGAVVQERDALATKMEGVMSLFNDDTPAEQRESVTRQILSDAGYGAEEVDAYIDVVGMNSESTTENEGVTVADQNSQTQQTAPDDNRVRHLEQQLEEMRKGQHQIRVRELEFSLNGNLDRVLDSHPKLKLLFAKTKELQPSDADEKATQDAVARARAAVKSQLKREALEKLNLRRTQAGTFEDRWMEEEVDKAVEPVLSIYQSVIGDIDRIGRTPETVAGGPLGRDVLSRDPVPPPKYEAGKDNTKMLRAWTEDSLLRMAAEGTGETSKA